MAIRSTIARALLTAVLSSGLALGTGAAVATADSEQPVSVGVLADPNPPI
jgi:uncharacterized membrane protein